MNGAFLKFVYRSIAKSTLVIVINDHNVYKILLISMFDPIVMSPFGQKPG